MNANETLLAADDFQLHQRELAVSARARALAEAERAMRANVRALDKAATERLLRATVGQLRPESGERRAESSRG